MTMAAAKEEEKAAANAGPRHERLPSVDLGELSLFEIELPEKKGEEVAITEIDVVESKPETAILPESHLVLIAETEVVEKEDTLMGSFSDLDFEVSGTIKVKNWDGKKFYSDYIKEGLEYVKKGDLDVVMLFESPRSSTAETTFHNATKFKFHDWPPPKSSKSLTIMGPTRYSLMNGASFPAFLKWGNPPQALMDHWKEAVPGYVESKYTKVITEQQHAYAYLPVEALGPRHVNDPDIHYHLAGKDAIHLMTTKTTKLLPDTRTSRPCVVKTTHSMGSKGIFIIQDDEDEKEFEDFLKESGNPTFVVTDFVDIARNVACHFFMHPDGKTVTWFGSNENKRDESGKFTSDSYLDMDDQKSLKDLQMPFVEEVVKYCHGLNFWGFCGIDVLMDSQGNGYLVDINPRCTGSCPALMTLSQLKRKYGFTKGMFRRSGATTFHGSEEELLAQVHDYNVAHEGESRIVIHCTFQAEGKKHTRVNIGVYGKDLEVCKRVLNEYAK